MSTKSTKTALLFIPASEAIPGTFDSGVRLSKFNVFPPRLLSDVADLRAIAEPGRVVFRAAVLKATEKALLLWAPQIAGKAPSGAPSLRLVERWFPKSLCRLALDECPPEGLAVYIVDGARWIAEGYAKQGAPLFVADGGPALRDKAPKQGDVANGAERPTLPTAPQRCAHNGTYTVSGADVPDLRFTFKIRTQAKDAAFAPCQRVLSILHAAENDDARSYRGVGFVHADEKTGASVFSPWRNASPRDVAKARIGLTLADHAAAGFVLGEGAEVLLDGRTLQVSTRCVRCDRVLTTPESIRSGIGPTCGARD